ncbi:MAG: flavin reductase family protein [Candidatus Zixiibacteriota bacterium]
MASDIAKVLRTLEYGVYVVTMGEGDTGNAFTASWLTQVSSDPPMLAMAVNNKHQSTRLLKEHGSFAVNLIAAGQEAVAKTYYGPAESGYQKLSSYNVGKAPVTGCPIISGAIGFLDCRITNMIVTGNHTLIIGEVVAAKYDSSEPILSSSNSKLRYTG